ncbi:MAG: phosphotransferase [Gemmobacter sp.]|uniref:phosphotransferase n=1 Tax=Gemmobacter sp. TaxID=1898957 RepID=UPI001A5ED03E|nr:phosphotransferase [Gemmobacter sp.]MBL8562743.1 phosphotransferase [Gemmobacter sp.]
MNRTAHLSSPQPDAALRRAVLGLCGADHAEWHPLEGGRSNQVWRCGTVVVKQYRPEAATPLFPNDPALEAAALCAFSPLGLAPALLARGDGWIAWRHVSGRIWQGEPGVAALLQHLSLAQGFPGLAVRPMGARAIAAQARSFAPSGLPPLPELAEVALPKPSVLHGDLVPGNILSTERGLCLIDWQCPAMGDPVDDLALFLSPAMQWLYRGKVLEADARQGLLAQLPAPLADRYRHLAPVLHWRIAAHCALRAGRGDAGYDTALRLELASL